jgi:TonB family protein
MINELLRELLQAALASSAAMMLLLLVRRPLRERFGARVAYGAWLLVPVAILAVWMPAPTLPEGEQVAAAAVVGAPAWSTGLLVSTAVDAAGLLAFAWFAGVVLCAAWFATRQARFNRLLARRAGSAFDTVSGHGPAVVGWWRSRIVLPDDFRERYTRGEQQLVLAHEIAHLRRGDIHAQALATGLRCLFWFNPLLHFAAGRFRFDQELACDASVLERFPRARGRYGAAMLKTQLAGFGLPVGCHWQSSHPLKERISMLKQPLPARTRKLSGSLLVAMLMTAGSYAAWAAQPATPAPAKSNVPYLQRVTSEDSLQAPKYPAGTEKLSGKVLLELLVGADGNVKDVKVISAEPVGVFEQASIEAARTWHITPALEHGKPVPHRVRVPVWFEPDGKEPKKS